MPTWPRWLCPTAVGWPPPIAGSPVSPDWITSTPPNEALRGQSGPEELGSPHRLAAFYTRGDGERPGEGAVTVTEAEVYYDPYDVGINADPYPTFRRLRDEAPVYHNERYGFWALSRFADVERALVNWETFSNCRSDILEIIQSGAQLPPGVVMFEDPPLHANHRGLMSRVFTPRRMAELEDRVRAFCVRCLDPLVGSGGFDIIEVLGTVMPMRVIGMLLGIPEADQVAVRDRSDATLR